MTKGHRKTWGTDGYVHYFYCGDGFMAVSVCQNPSKYTLFLWAVYCTSLKHLNEGGEERIREERKGKEERKNKLSHVGDIKVPIASIESGTWKSVINCNVRLELPELNSNGKVQT